MGVAYLKPISFLSFQPVINIHGTRAEQIVSSFQKTFRGNPFSNIFAVPPLIAESGMRFYLHPINLVPSPWNGY